MSTASLYEVCGQPTPENGQKSPEEEYLVGSTVLHLMQFHYLIRNTQLQVTSAVRQV